MEDVQSLSFNQLLERCFLLAGGSGSSTSHAKASEDPSLQLLLLLELAARRAAQLALVNPAEERLREVSTGALRSLFIQSLRGEAEASVRTGFEAKEERKRRLANSKVHYTSFLSSLRSLKIVPPSTDALLKAHAQLYEASSSDGSDNSLGSRTALPSNAALSQSAKRREIKIALFKTERSLKSSLEQFREAVTRSKEYAPRPPHSVPDDVFYDAMFLSKAVGEDREDEDDEEEEEASSSQAAVAGSSTDAVSAPQTVRSYIMLLLNLHAVKASSSLESAQQELELLSSMPSQLTDNGRSQGSWDRADLRERAREGADSDWKLDRGPGASGSMAGPLLDDKGRPLRPFTITASDGNKQAAGPAPDLDARQRIRQEVFRPSHRLPTMSIDEYLEEEQRRGNIIEGGGAKSMEEPTPREARALRAEEDGSREAQEAEEEKRKEQIEWDAFTEANPKGAGNTMNRG